MKQSKPLSASILIALALFLSVAASGSGDKSQHQATHHQSAAKDQSAYRPQPPTIIIEPAPVRIIQPAPAAEKQTIMQKWYQRPSITDWGVLVVTAVYALIALGLLKATLRQARFAQDTLAEIRKTAIASEVAANATRDSVQVSKSAVRPYIWVRKVEGHVNTGVKVHQIAGAKIHHLSGRESRDLGSGRGSARGIFSLLFSRPIQRRLGEKLPCSERRSNRG